MHPIPSREPWICGRTAVAPKKRISEAKKSSGINSGIIDQDVPIRLIKVLSPDPLLYPGSESTKVQGVSPSILLNQSRLTGGAAYMHTIRP